MNRRFRFPTLRALFLTAVALSAISCDSTAKTDDLETQQALLVAVMRPTDVRGYCILSETASFNCATAFYGSASNYATLGVQPVYGVTVSSPFGAPEICAVIPTSAVFANNTEGGKICRFQCNQQYWEAKKAAGVCTAGNYLGLVSTALAGQDACLKECLVRGTVVYP